MLRPRPETAPPERKKQMPSFTFDAAARNRPLGGLQALAPYPPARENAPTATCHALRAAFAPLRNLPGPGFPGSASQSEGPPVGQAAHSRSGRLDAPPVPAPGHDQPYVPIAGQQHDTATRHAKRPPPDQARHLPERQGSHAFAPDGWCAVAPRPSLHVRAVADRLPAFPAVRCAAVQSPAWKANCQRGQFRSIGGKPAALPVSPARLQRRKCRSPRQRPTRPGPHGRQAAVAPWRSKHREQNCR